MRLAAALFAALAPVAALACGVCDDDKVAATYDAAGVQRAAQRHLAVAFFDVRNDRLAPAQLVARLRRAAAGIAGVETSSIRISTDPAALSLAFDAGRSAAPALLEQLRASLGGQGVTLRLIRVLPAEAGAAP